MHKTFILVTQEAEKLGAYFFLGMLEIEPVKDSCWILKGILSWSTNFLYVKELILLSSETYFLSKSEVRFPSKSRKNQKSWY